VINDSQECAVVAWEHWGIRAVTDGKELKTPNVLQRMGPSIPWRIIPVTLECPGGHWRGNTSL